MEPPLPAADVPGDTHRGPSADPAAGPAGAPTGGAAGPPADDQDATRADGDGSRVLGRSGATWLRWAALPVLAVLLALVLSALQLHGSSLALYDGPSASDADLVLGEPRPTRTDDWFVAEPIVIGQARAGLPVDREIGVGTTALPTIAMFVPTGGWTMAFRPQHWGFLVLPVENAVALRWWGMPLVGLLGVYALLGVLTRRPGISAALAVLLCLSPAFAWWSGLSAYLVLGYSCAATAAGLVAVRARTRAGSVGWGLVAGAATTAFALSIYPPWQLCAVLVLLPVLVVEVLRERRRLLLPAAAAASVCLVAGAAFVLQFADALEQTAGTVYPGQRRSPSNEGFAWALLSAPFGPWLSDGRYVPLSNPTELSSAWPLAPLLAVVLLPPFAVLLTPRARRVLWACLVPAGVLLAWALLPVPEIVGRVLLLDRVQGSRVWFGLGLAGVLALAMVWTGEPRPRSRPPAVGDAGGPTRVRTRQWSAAAAAAVVGLALLLWAARGLPVPGLEGTVRVALPAGFALLTALLLTPLRRPALAGLLVWGVASWAPVNPLYRGLGELGTSALGSAVQELSRTAPDGNWLVAEDRVMAHLVVAQGVDTVSGLNGYPDVDAWRALDPEGRAEDVWNRYSLTQWHLGPPGSAPVFGLEEADLVEVTVDPCDAGLAALEVTFVVEPAQLAQPHPCLEPLRTVEQSGRSLRISRVVAPR